MEVFLLWLDELDDLVAMVGMVWRSIASFLAAVALFVATGFAFISMPMMAEVLALVLVVVGLGYALRERRQAHAEELADESNGTLETVA